MPRSSSAPKCGLVLGFCVVFALLSASTALRIPQRTITLTSSLITTHVVFQRDSSLPADALVASVKLLGTGAPTIVLPEEVLVNQDGAISVTPVDLPIPSTAGATSKASSSIAASLSVSLCGLFVCFTLLRPKWSSAIAILAIICAWQLVQVSALRAFDPSWSLEITVSVPNDYVLESLTLNIARGSVVGGAIASKTLSLQLCNNAAPNNFIQTYDANIVNSASICASGAVSMYGLSLGDAASVSVTSASSEVNLILRSELVGSISATTSAGNAIVSGSCTYTTDTALSKVGTCGAASQRSLTARAAAGILLSVSDPKCNSNPPPSDPAATDSVPVSPAMPQSTPGVSFVDWPSSAADIVASFGATPFNSSFENNVMTSTITGSGTTWYYIFTKQIFSALRADGVYTASFDLMCHTGNTANVTVVGAFVTTATGNLGSNSWNTSMSYASFSQPLPSAQGSWFSYSTNLVLPTYGSGYQSRNNFRRPRFAIRISMSGSANSNRWVFSMRNLRFRLQAAAYPSNPTLLTSSSELVVLPRPPATLDPNPRTNCPHLQSGLLNWHDPATWGGAVPKPTDATITLPANSKVLISSCSLIPGAIYNKIVVPSGSELVFNDADMSVNVRNIRVDGKLSMGSPTCRLFSRITITFHGASSDQDDIGNGYGTKGIGVSATGVIEVHGKQFHQTWTRLAATAAPGDDVLYLQEAVNWEVGQEIVLVTTSYIDEFDPQNEQLIIKAISADGKRIQLTSPVRFWHYGGVEYQAEVGLLSRRIVFQGSASSEADKFGGHILVMGDGRFSGLQLVRMGQQNKLARYPLHFHLGGSRPNCFVKDCSFLRSFYRCVSIHQTNDTQVLRNVAYDVSGFCYYLEEGVEENNDISYNLAAHVHTIYEMMANRLGGQSGDTDFENETQPLPADRAAAGFYITNAYNKIVGNAASGGWAGISLPNLPTPLGFSRNWPVSPERRPTLIFEGNTAHSCTHKFLNSFAGYSWDFGGCIYLGGRLFYDAANGGKLRYNSGRNSRSPRIGTRDVWMRFNNTKVFLCNMGFNHWGDRPEVVGFEAHDIQRAGQLFGDAWLSNGIVNAKSNNPISFNRNSQGFQFYDTWSKAVLTRVTFRNYRNTNPTGDPHTDFTGLIGMTHSDEFKPQNLAATRDIRWQNCDDSARIGIRNQNTGSSRYYAMVDFDGSVVGTPGQAYILGSATSTWWNYDTNCVRRADWNAYACPKGSVDVGVLDMEIWNYIDGGLTPNVYVGNTTLWGRGVPQGSTSPLTKLPGVTGPTNVGWYTYFDLGAPSRLNITVTQVPQGSAIYWASRYPAGTTFAITGSNPYFGGKNTAYSAAASLGALWSGPGTSFFFDQTHLYLKLTNPWNTRTNFTRDGAYLWTPDSAYHWSVKITASCTSSGQWCTEPVNYAPPPSSSWWN